MVSFIFYLHIILSFLCSNQGLIFLCRTTSPKYLMTIGIPSPKSPLILPPNSSSPSKKNSSKNSIFTFQTSDTTIPTNSSPKPIDILVTSRRIASKIYLDYRPARTGRSTAIIVKRREKKTRRKNLRIYSFK